MKATTDFHYTEGDFKRKKDHDREKAIRQRSRADIICLPST